MPVERIAEAAINGAIGLFWWASYYLYIVSKGNKFHVVYFLINLFLAFFIGYVVGQFLDPSMAYRDGIIAVSGFCALPILSFLEKNGAKLILNQIPKWPDAK